MTASEGESQVMPAPEQGSLEENLCAGIGQSLSNVLWVLGDSRASRALRMLDDPSCQLSPSEILDKAGITFGDLAMAYRDYRITVALIRAYVAAPKIVSDIADNSENQVISCKRCDGLAEIATTEIDPDTGLPLMRDCPACFGAGLVTVPGDRHSRKQFLQLVGLDGRGAHEVQVNIKQQHRGWASLEQVILVADKALKLCTEPEP